MSRPPAEARFDYLLNRPEAENIGAKVNGTMRDIEKHNPQLAGVLTKTHNLFTSTLLKELLKRVSEISASLDGDAFGRIDETLRLAHSKCVNRGTSQVNSHHGCEYQRQAAAGHGKAINTFNSFSI